MSQRNVRYSTTRISSRRNDKINNVSSVYVNINRGIRNNCVSFYICRFNRCIPPYTHINKRKSTVLKIRVYLYVDLLWKSFLQNDRTLLAKILYFYYVLTIQFSFVFYANDVISIFCSNAFWNYRWHKGEFIIAEIILI